VLAIGIGESATESGPGASGGFLPPKPDAPAPHFPQLEILDLIGRGGMGAVYKARQPHLDRLVALKILPPETARDAAFADRFGREARTMARLNHRGIVTLYDFGRAGEYYYFLMEYVDGASLRPVIREGELSPAEALAIVPQICDALQCAHDQGGIHRDKPDNILLDRAGCVKIADFGLAKLFGQPIADQSLTATGQVMGTPHYMAPEQMQGAAGSIIGPTFMHWAWCSTSCSPASCRWGGSRLRPKRSSSTCGSIKSCFALWRRIPSGVTSTPAK
jgi:serine/threonine-protein kinase